MKQIAIALLPPLGILRLWVLVLVLPVLLLTSCGTDNLDGAETGTSTGTFTGTMPLTLGLNGVTPTGEHKITAYMMLVQFDELTTGTTLTISLETNRNRHTYEKTLSKDMTYEYGMAYTATVDAWTDS